MRILGWLRNLFRRRRSLDRLDLYSPAERLIYRYFDGQKVRRADPMVLYKNYAEVRTDLLVDLRGYYSSLMPEDKSNACHTGAVAKIRKIFDVPALGDEGGLTDGEVLDLLNHFTDYIDSVKKNSRSIPTTATATSAATPSCSEAGPPTSSTLDSGSTASASSTAAPAPSPAESPSLSA